MDSANHLGKRRRNADLDPPGSIDRVGSGASSPRAGGLALDEVIKADEAEKRRIARELHDGVGQALTSAIFTVDMLTRRLPETSGVEKGLAEIRESLLQCAESLRDLSFRLRPPMLEDLGLVPTLGWLFRHSGLERQVALTWEFLGLERRLPADTELTLFRIVQEATNNIIKHSRARNVAVRLEVGQEWACLVIADDGVGLAAVPSANSARSPMGLRGMRERVEAQNGRLDVHSRAGLGTKIVVHLPLAEAWG